MLISDWSSDVCSSDLADAFEKLAVERLLNRANRDVAEVYARLATMSCKFATCLKCRCRPSRCHGSKRTIHGESLRRVEERRVGKEWVRKCRSRWLPEN